MSGINKTKLYFIITAIFFVLVTTLTFNFAHAAGAGIKIPPPVGYVNDFAGIISSQNKSSLDSYLGQLDKKTGVQVAVVTLKSLQGNSVEDVALDIGRNWGVGQKGKNNGIVILVATGDRKMRIEVGYGLEGIITDGKAGRIRDDYMIPEFRQGNMEKGVINGTVAVASEIARAYKVEMPAGFNSSVSELSKNSPHSAALKASDFDTIIIIFIITMFIINPRVFLWFLLGLPSGGYRNYGGGFGGSSGGSDFGGFSGGSFGGGGSSGKW